PITLSDTAIRLVTPTEVYSAVAPGTVVLAKDGSAGSLDLAITPQGDGPGAFMLHRGKLDLSQSAVALSLAPVGTVPAGKAHATVLARFAQGEGKQATVVLGLSDVVLPAIGVALKTLALTGQVTAEPQRVAMTVQSCVRLDGLIVKRLIADTLPVCPGAE